MKKTTKLLWLACLCMLACLFVFSACEEATEDPDHVHSYGSWTVTKEATCKEAGSQERVCECGDKQTKTLPMKDHSFGDWKIAKEATCKVTGVQERVCKCGEKQTKTIPIKDHSFGEWKTVKKATCIATGLKECICSGCGAKETRSIATGSHIWVEYECVLCGKTKDLTLDISDNNVLTIDKLNWDINSARGVEPSITYTNHTDKQIAYINFTVKFYDRMGRAAYCSIKNQHSIILTVTGPIQAGEKDTSYWGPAIYNGATAVIKPLRVEIEFTDGTKLTIISTGQYWYDKSFYGGKLYD